MKIEIEEHDIKSTISSQLSVSYLAEDNIDKVQECHKLEGTHTTGSQNNILTRQVLSTEITDNIKQSQLAGENAQFKNLNLNAPLRKIKAEQDINISVNKPFKELKVMLFKENLKEKTHMKYKKYVAFMFNLYVIRLVLCCIFWEIPLAMPIKNNNNNLMKLLNNT